MPAARVIARRTLSHALTVAVVVTVATPISPSSASFLQQEAKKQYN